jgi:hypothetical protein
MVIVTASVELGGALHQVLVDLDAHLGSDKTATFIGSFDVFFGRSLLVLCKALRAIHTTINRLDETVFQLHERKFDFVVNCGLGQDFREVDLLFFTGLDLGSHVFFLENTDSIG